ncbi:MAG: FMN-binding protein [Clostridia bacterium]|nr:FMN-binding protein [Clostridia bacterium]
MKPLGKDMLSLLVAAVLATGLLWGSDKLTRSLIEKQETERVAAVFSDLLPADRFEALSTAENKPITAAYRAFDTQNRLLGFAVTVKVDGYAGPITVHAALSADATTVYGIRIGEHRETVGYGAGITETSFLSQFQNRTPPFSLTAGDRILQDGVYRAAENNFDSSGFRDFVEVTVSGQEITAVNWDAEQQNSTETKKSLSRAGKYVMSQTGLAWHEQAEIMELALLEKQDPSAIVYQPDTGKTDAYSGATISVEPFVRLAASALAQATKTGAAAVDGVSGATTSSTAVVNAVNTAATFIKNIVG